ncbi:O-antigen ligase family protein [Streptomyces sp. NPDC008139]|uniref:O-antigen ligase family protein n=1 Tax=Streptomyces sp. NPDC008139 TaxID=3364814 RepID=UPI0036E99836
MATIATPAPARNTAPAHRAEPAPRIPPGLARYRWLAPLLPALATVLLLAAPVSTGDVSTSGKVTPADAASAVLILTVAVRLLRDRARPLTATAAVVLGAPVVGFALSAVTSVDPAAGLTGFLRYAQVFVLVPASLVLLLRDRRDFAVVAGAVVAVALVQGAIGVWQYATATGASYMGEDIRAVGTFGPSDIMGMATVVAYGLVIATGCALVPAAAGAPRWLRPAALACAAALLVPLAVSFSRGTWIATAVTCAAMIVLSGRRQALCVFGVLTASAVLLVGGLGVGSQMIGQRVSSITRVTADPDPSVTDRYTLWAAAVSMWRQHPATGVGLKRFPDERDGHASLALSSGSDTAGAGQRFTREPLLSPHNMYLLALSEQGLIGFALLVGGWAAFLTRGTDRLLRARRARVRAPGAAASGLAAVGLLIWQCVDFLYADIGGPSTVLTAVLLGLTAWWALSPAADAAAGAAADLSADATVGRRR